jgi:parallel beta-helix repeat protein
MRPSTRLSGETVPPLDRNAPIAFLSYVHDDDKASFGFISRLREHLEEEVRARDGDNGFAIFQDRKDIKWSQQWEKRLKQGVEGCALFLPVVTPRYFTSEPCRKELEQFLALEQSLGRDDLVLPLLFLDTKGLDKDSDDPLKIAIAAHQWRDWRHLRRESQNSQLYLNALDEAAQRMVDILASLGPDRVKSPPPPKAPPPDDNRMALEAMVRREPSPPPPPEPAALIVDGNGIGNFFTITDAIAAAQPGSRILVRPGTYEESLEIDKPLELIGDGPPGSVVVTTGSGKEVITATAAMGRIANLTLRQMGGIGYGLWLRHGRMEIEDCDISGSGFRSVAIIGPACPTLRRNRIHGANGGSGLVVSGATACTIEDNDISGNQSSGLIIAKGATPLVRGNRIHGNGLYGCQIRGGSGGEFTGNTLTGNGSGAWNIDESSLPRVIRSGNTPNQ